MHLACEGTVMATSQHLYIACQDQLVRVPRDQLGAIEYLDDSATDVPEVGLAALTAGSLTYVYRGTTASGDLELKLRRWNEVKQAAESVVTVTVPAPNGGDLVVSGARVFAISSSPGWAAPSDIYHVTQSGEVAGPSAANCVLVRWFSEGDTMYWEEYDANLPSGYPVTIARFNPTSLAREVIGYLEDSQSAVAVSDAYVYVSSAFECKRYPKAGGALESAGTNCPMLFSPQFDFAPYYYYVPIVEKRPKGQLQPVVTRKLSDWSQVWAAWADDDEVVAKVYSAGPLPYYYRIRMPTPAP